MQKNYHLLIIMLSAMVTISTLYITQPIQPLLIEEFTISTTQVTLFTSIPLFMLAIAPIFYGYLLEKFDTRLILVISLALLGIFQCLLCLSQQYSSFLLLRIGESLAIPAALTATVTCLTRIDSSNKYIGVYVASTIFGGVLSRVGGGLLTTIFSWKFTFLALGITSFLIATLAIKLPNTNAKIKNAKITFRIFLDFLTDKRYFLLYCGAFLILFCFQGTLNFMPLYVSSLDPNTTAAQIGFMYLGYIIGILAALFSQRIVKLLGGEIKAISVGFVIFACACFMMIYGDFWQLFFAVFVLSAGMFIINSTLSSLINTISANQKGITNGLYLASYYAGGALGTTLPTYIYRPFGWNALCLTLGVILFLSALIFYQSQKYFIKG
ncbi:MFS transporter [Helicobacter canadensis]|uniref:Transporter n=1 Tax=Helicobacter canadensis MIT 98-5491 TaxID=537970 RepID=C5ZWH8_9HELI|nr:MFS transporter [Helicobacter canadensis]EES89496.1 putative transporter [Helicobacter canadensis MIT 98-5491]EFR48287.1 transporter, major facilitator family protein [Helicobacter canadensis MIT 98-5491]STO99534.1 major facilitator superfamily protein [Helicobacter canadensis]